MEGENSSHHNFYINYYFTENESFRSHGPVGLTSVVHIRLASVSVAVLQRCRFSCVITLQDVVCGVVELCCIKQRGVPKTTCLIFVPQEGILSGILQVTWLPWDSLPCSKCDWDGIKITIVLNEWMNKLYFIVRVQRNNNKSQRIQEKTDEKWQTPAKKHNTGMGRESFFGTGTGCWIRRRTFILH